MEFLFLLVMGKPVWMWLAFLGIVIGLLVLDLGLLHKDDHEIEVGESLRLSAMYIALGTLFAGFVWWQIDFDSAAKYMTAFVVEKTLAMDNIFVMALIFSYFAIPRAYQHRVLFWGILGVIVLRGIMIALGATIVHSYEWVLYIFAVFLIFTGIKMLFIADKEHNIGDNALIKFLKTRLRVTDELHGHDFTVKKKDPVTGKLVRYATPLMLALIAIEIADVIFAVDSVPAVFTITTDPYIVYTSNIFAILGLRALYFALAAILHRFAYLKYALSLLLVFIGSKIFIADLMGWEKFPPAWSLGITFAILGVGMAFSIWKTKDNNAAQA
ncbi:TerC/Alx family metal homeostasis membrane protein [Microvirga tunisiensis]|uniref:TerC/Alx family metal homeostasis membrane protein n=2 Tax=Pannonibacter tanglangensis TaxID=2750084 RepID=A0ABW9ZHD7_9HYPH|nr:MULTISPECIES: TerC family protein [unclassified Pannonibacter]NBN64181.1 TerC/Alx family metal homeostasis membrane protein [Pannonibacter sp. XCT-34]NBN78715.1 TerC/Alx family metal homeostasis membrane protein [Pannonibacter sp. XCT-53]